MRVCCALAAAYVADAARICLMMRAARRDIDMSDEAAQ